MSALPTLKYYNGFPLAPSVDADWVAELIEGGFQLYSDDVLIVTYPKSGTTWTQQVVSLIRGLPRGGEETHVFNSIPWLEKSKDVTLVSYIIIILFGKLKQLYCIICVSSCIFKIPIPKNTIVYY